MKYMYRHIFLLAVSICAIANIDGYETAESRIRVALIQPDGGESTWISAKPLAEVKGSVNSQRDNKIVSVIEYDYIVDNKIHYINACFVIHEQSGQKTTFITKKLPIRQDSITTDIAPDLKAYALLEGQR